MDTPDLGIDIPTFSLSSRPLFIFDYDCCLLPTFEIQRLGLTLDGPDVDPAILHELDAVGRLVVNTLTAAQRFGRVCIVTNAETGWVELTSSRFFPAYASFFASIEVFSARSLFEAQGFTSPLVW